MVFCRAAHVSLPPLNSFSHCSSTSCVGCALSEYIRCGLKDPSRWRPRAKVFQCGLLDLSGTITGEKVFGGTWRTNPSRSSGSSMLHQKRQQDAERAGAASAPRCIRGSAAGSGLETGLKADPVMRSHCSTWRNTSLKKPTSERHGTLPVKGTDSDQGTGTCANDAASRGSNRAVASSDGHEIRLDPA